MTTSTSLAAAVADQAVAAAVEAGLRHVDDGRPGLTRRRSGRAQRVGKCIIPTFVFEDAAGRRITEAAALERIRKLAIPPAWRAVWICPDARGHIQATGRDARGRKQYRYHARWREERDGTKYARMISFARALPAIRRAVAADLARPGLPRRRVLAAVARLLETTFIRVGNEEYARTNGSFGLTTLKDRHVTFKTRSPTPMTFHFRGKSGVVHDVAVADRKLARIVRQCRDLPGQELFQYVGDDGQPTAIDSADVNAYLREIAGDAFTAKDFRTWAGTVLAARALGDVAQGGSRRPTNRDVKRAVERVAERLGNTPAVCRKCYIHPEIIAAFLDGELCGSPLGRASRGGGLRPEERAVLSLLRARDRTKDGRLVHQLRHSLSLRPKKLRQEVSQHRSVAALGSRAR